MIKNTGINFYLQNKKNVSFGLSLKKNLIHISSRNYRNIDFAVNKGSIVKLHLSENSSIKN